jgi:Calx-beta domain/PASTA domain
VETAEDALDETDETFTVSLSDASNAEAPTRAIIGTIVDDDDPPSLKVDDVRVGEGAGPARFHVALSAPSGQNVLMRYETRPETASGADFTPIAGNLTFAPGDVTAAIDVPITTDELDEPDELFRLAVIPIANVTGEPVANGTIIDDDAASQPPPQPRPRCVVPNVRGKTVTQARRTLSARKCALGRVTRAYSQKVRRGRIISQRRRPGARLPRGTRVNVVVSRGNRR